MLSSLWFRALILMSTALTMKETHLYMMPAGEYHLHDIVYTYMEIHVHIAH